MKLQKQGFQVVEISLKPSKKTRNDTKRKSFGNEGAVRKSSMETHGQKQANNDANASKKSLQTLVTVTVALIVIALWAFAR